jgi:hypothetical protein
VRKAGAAVGGDFHDTGLLWLAAAQQKPEVVPNKSAGLSVNGAFKLPPALCEEERREFVSSVLASIIGDG